MGVCKYCGQVVIDTVNDEEASESCQCIEAEAHRKLLRAAQGAKEIIRDLFGEGCAKYDLIQLNADVIEKLLNLVDLFGAGDISQAQIQVNGICKVKITRTGFSIKVERVEGRKYSNVAGVQ